MISLRRAWTILRKELVDNARDHRAWLMAATYVIIGPLLLLLVIFMAGRVLADESKHPVELPVVGAERAPSLLEYLKQRNLIPVPTSEDPSRLVSGGTHAAVLVIAPGYALDLSRGQPATVQLYFDGSRSQFANEVGRVHQAVRAFDATMGRLRLVARGVDPDVVHALAIEEVDLATPHSRASFLFALIPIFLLMSLFVGSLYIAIDTTAGERERGSLEPLLLNPITPAELIIGKLGAIALFGMTTVLLAISGFALVLNAAPLDIPRVRLGLSASGVCWLVAVMMPAALLAATLQLRLASACRTFREAQTTGQFLMLLPALPGLLQILGSVELLVARYVPIIGQHLLIERVLKAEPMAWVDFVVVSCTTVLLGILLAIDTVRHFDRTRILFG